MPYSGSCPGEPRSRLAAGLQCYTLFIGARFRASKWPSSGAATGIAVLLLLLLPRSAPLHPTLPICCAARPRHLQSRIVRHALWQPNGCVAARKAALYVHMHITIECKALLLHVASRTLLLHPLSHRPKRASDSLSRVQSVVLL